MLFKSLFTFKCLTADITLNKCGEVVAFGRCCIGRVENHEGLTRVDPRSYIVSYCVDYASRQRRNLRHCVEVILGFTESLDGWGTLRDTGTLGSDTRLARRFDGWKTDFQIFARLQRFSAVRLADSTLDFGDSVLVAL